MDVLLYCNDDGGVWGCRGCGGGVGCDGVSDLSIEFDLNLKLRRFIKLVDLPRVSDLDFSLTSMGGCDVRRDEWEFLKLEFFSL